MIPIEAMIRIIASRLRFRLHHACRELHRYRKTYADTLHEEGVSVNTIRIRLGHESLDVTPAYLKDKDAESEEAQEHANSSSLALYA